MIDSYPWPASSWVPTYAISFWGSLGLHSHMKYVIHTFIMSLYCKIQGINRVSLYFIGTALGYWLYQSYLMHTTRSSVMLASQRWHTEDHFRLVASHRAMPSLCPLPSAVNTGGEAILLPWEVSSRKRGSALVLVTAGLGLKNRFLVPKPPSWHLGVPGARHRHPLSSLAREWGLVGGM